MLETHVIFNTNEVDIHEDLCQHIYPPRLSDIRQVWPLESWKESWFVLEGYIDISFDFVLLRFCFLQNRTILIIKY